MTTNSSSGMLVVDSSETTFEAGDVPHLSYRHLAVRDLLNGLRKSWFWFALASQDIKLRYRGSVLGRFGSP